MIEPGTILQGRYRIEKQIGVGGMGAVFVAVDQRFGSTVAIKKTLFSDERLGKAFEREARLLNSLRHPVLPRVSDHFAESHSQFLVMEFIPGDDLADILESEKKPLDVGKAAAWFDQLLDALDYLHSQEIPVIHRDIKPQNLKLTERGEIILLDFGLAKGNPTNGEHQTQAKSIFGYSKNYASIEQMQGTGTDPRSDLYSLCATMYHLMTGVIPEDALSRAMMVLSDRPDPIIPANKLNPDIPQNVSYAIMAGLSMNAADRPASANAMRDILAGRKPLDSPIMKPVAATVVEDKAAHDAATQILPENLTQQTVARENANVVFLKTQDSIALASPQKKGGIGKYIAAAFGLLVLGVLALGAVFVGKMFMEKGAAANTAAKPSASPAPQNPVNAAPVTSANSVAVPLEADSTTAANQSEPKPNAVISTPKETKNTSDPVSVSTPKPVQKENDPPPVASKPTPSIAKPTPGETAIQTRPTPPPPNVPDVVRPRDMKPDLRNLPPRERRRIIEMLRRQQSQPQRP